MKKNTTSGFRWMAAAVYCYLTIPFIIFALGWCKLYIGIPIAVLAAVGMFFCIKEQGGHEAQPLCLRQTEWLKLLLVLAFVLLWVGLSGIGNYAWQNSDHTCRNAIFNSLVNHSWPDRIVISTETGTESRALIYYIGFWLPAALIGKLLGLDAGYAAQYVWAVLGIFLVYWMICIWRRKVLVWPMLVLIGFSGLDVIGAYFAGYTMEELLSVVHLDYWAHHFQFSCMTTQLYWVFNQALPAWVATVFCLLYEKPRNMLFLISLLILPSTFPFMGIIPFAIYFMITRAEGKENCNSVRNILSFVRKNWFSFQNILAGGCVCVLSALYLMQNTAIRNSLTFLGHASRITIIGYGSIAVLLGLALAFCLMLLVAKKKFTWLKNIAVVCVAVFLLYGIYHLTTREWESKIFVLANCILFLLLEIGVWLAVIHDEVEKKALFYVTILAALMCPLCTLGFRRDFCMRASIPMLLMLYLWIVKILDERKSRLKVKIIVFLLILGAFTPLHEIRRAYYYTRENKDAFETVSDEEIHQGTNFSGQTNGLFWKYLAKDGEKK